MNNYNNLIAQKIMSCPECLTKLENVDELDLVNLTKPLVDISCYNKKYSTVAYDEDFLKKLTSSEQASFNNSINALHALLTKFLIKREPAFSEETNNSETRTGWDSLDSGVQNDEPLF